MYFINLVLFNKTQSKKRLYQNTSEILDDDRRTVKTILEVEDQSELAIGNFKVHVTSCTTARSYENNAMSINPSYDDHAFNLKALFPLGSNSKRFTAVNKANQEIEDLSTLNVPEIDTFLL
jgi:hypothetical protein